MLRAAAAVADFEANKFLFQPKVSQNILFLFLTQICQRFHTLKNEIIYFT